MGKLAELQAKAGNPDLSHWIDINFFSIAEAAMLTAGIDPNTIEHNWGWKDAAIKKPNGAHAVMIARAIREAICIGTIQTVLVIISDETGYESVIKPENLDIASADSICEIKTKISRKMLLDWYRFNGYVDTQSRQKKTAPQIPPAETANPKPLSLPKYTTPELTILNEIVAEHWEGFDPDDDKFRAPKQEVVVNSIKYKFIERGHPNPSQTMMEYMDRIVRHSAAKVGGNKKRKG